VLPSGLTKKQVRKSLKNSILDGATYSSMAGLTQNYITPYALAMNASTTQIGFLAGIPSIAMVMTQLMSPTLVERLGSRKRFIVLGAFLHTAMWLPILLIPYIFHTNQVWWLIAFITLCTAFDAMGNAPWNSMMADLVPEQVRGRYFARRSRIASFVSLILSFVAGGVLQFFTKNGYLGFTIILAGALISRFCSAYYLSLMDEPPALMPKHKQASILQLSRSLVSTNVGKFILFNAFLSFSTNFASPFFSVYMLRDLQFNYLIYFIAVAIPTLTTLLFIPFWGRRIDKSGNITVLKVTTLFVPVLPILWLVSTNVFYLCGVQAIAGFSWAGCNLAINLFLYSVTPAENRTRFIALFNVLMFAGVSFGSLLGGIMAPIVPRIFNSNLLTIFLISGLARIAVVFIFLPKISEVRHVHPTTVTEILFGGNHFPRVKGFSDYLLRRTNHKGRNN
jgi:MFS family permease